MRQDSRTLDQSSREDVCAMLEEEMANESWGLAATLLSQDGLTNPALLLWRDSDGAVKLCRVVVSSPGDDLSQHILQAAESFDFDHAILLARSYIALSAKTFSSPQVAAPPSTPRHGVALTYGSRVGHRSMHFAEIVENCGVFSLSDPTSVQSPLTPLDFVFRAASALH